jgi:hypothetical protein
MNNVPVLMTALICMATAGCWPVKKKPLLVPAAPIQPQASSPQAGATAPALPAIQPPAETAPSPATPRRPRRAPRTQAPQATTPPATTPSITPLPDAGQLVPTPQLGEILSKQRRQQLQASFDQSAGRAKAALNLALRAKLSREQLDTVARIRTFLTQAEAAKIKDLATAQQLARRADLLGADLVQSLR